jgi:hypothetical protein
MAVSVYQDCPWGKIRREWEDTSISLAALARKYGIRSVTTLERKRAAEQWSRVLTIDGHVVPSAAAAPPLVGEAERLPDQGVPNQQLTPEAIAVEVQRTGLLLLRRIQGVLPPPSDDPNDEALTVGNLQRLIRVNPERETLSGLLAAAVKTIETGMAMERRARADAAAQLAAAGGGGSDESLAQRAVALIETMDVETAEKMRAWAVTVQHQQREARIAEAAVAAK